MIDFIDWIKYNCVSQFISFEEGIKWVLVEDLTLQDNEIRRFTSEELYEHYKENATV